MVIAQRDILRSMHQDFILDPLLDGLLVGDMAQVLVQTAELVNADTGIARLLGIVIKDDFTLDLVNPDVRAHVILILVPGIKSDLLEDLVFHILDEVYQRSLKQLNLLKLLQVTKNQQH